MTTDEATRKLIDGLKTTCAAFGLGNDGNEYKIVIQVFLYKFFNDKFGYEAKKNKQFGVRLSNAEKWDAEYDTFSEDEVLDLFDTLPAGTPKIKPVHTISHLYNAIGKQEFSALLDSTMLDISNLNSDIFAVATEAGTKVNIFEPITTFIPDEKRRDEFAISLMRHVADPETNFEQIFSMKYDFFSAMFEHLIKDYNKDGGGKYAEYYTPRSIALIMAQLLVGEEKDLRSVECYDPSAGTGTLLMALAHTIGEDKCTIYSQDISQKSSKMLRLNLILNNLVSSIQNILQGDTLLHPGHKESDGSLKTFDFVVSNPPFKLDFPDSRETLAKDSIRFWAGVPNAPKKVNPEKPTMEIYTCFIQHMINSLKPGKGRGAIVVPTGFITAKPRLMKNIRERIVKEKWVYGCIIMPSNVFATTNTNVSVLFIDKAKRFNNVVLIDASKLGEEYKDGKNQRTRLRDFEIAKIVDTFNKREAVEDFSVVVSYDEIAEKGYSLSAGQYFDVKIEYVDITEEEFNARIKGYKEELSKMFEEGKELEGEIINGLIKL